MSSAVLKKSEVRKMLPSRSPDSHKGENGRVLIIGGSMDYFGAPILAGLGSLYSGADLTYLLVPECNFDVSRSFYPDFIVRKYNGNVLNFRSFEPATELLGNVDAVLMGPGLSKDAEAVRSCEKFLERIELPVVIDADALPSILSAEPKSNRPIVITPHLGEFNGLIEEDISKAMPEEEIEKLLQKYAKQWHAVILLKGVIDRIAAPNEEIYLNVTGNAGMTVGGTGDVLAGLVTSLIAQGMSPFPAACAAAFVNGLAGESLFKQKGNAFSATDLALELPYTIREILA